MAAELACQSRVWLSLIDMKQSS